MSERQSIVIVSSEFTVPDPQFDSCSELVSRIGEDFEQQRAAFDTQQSELLANMAQHELLQQEWITLSEELSRLEQSKSSIEETLLAMNNDIEVASLEQATVRSRIEAFTQQHKDLQYQIFTLREKKEKVAIDSAFENGYTHAQSSSKSRKISPKNSVYESSATDTRRHMQYSFQNELDLLTEQDDELTMQKEREIREDAVMEYQISQLEFARDDYFAEYMLPVSAREEDIIRRAEEIATYYRRETDESTVLMQDTQDYYELPDQIEIIDEDATEFTLAGTGFKERQS